jgi:hypothetical protein
MVHVDATERMSIALLYFASISISPLFRLDERSALDTYAGDAASEHSLQPGARRSSDRLHTEAHREECGCQIGGLQPAHRRDNTRESSSLGRQIYRAGNDGITRVHGISLSLGSRDNASSG